MAHTIIIGSGIIGLSTAYYLSESTNIKASEIHLVDSSEELFKCASGLAGGFLASNWFSQAVASLGALSFKLHRELAEEHGGKDRWGYSRTTGTSFTTGNDDAVDSEQPRGEDWLRDGDSRENAAPMEFREDEDGPGWLTRSKESSLEVIGRGDTVAQVDPRRLSQFLLEKVTERGVQLHQPAVVDNVTKDMRDCLAGARITTFAKDGSTTESDVPCTRIIITAGAWTPRVYSALFPASKLRIPITGLAGHSLLIKSPRWTKTMEENGCHAVFAADSQSDFSPEIFSRKGEEIYLAGLNHPEYKLPEKASDAEVRPEEMEVLKKTAARLLGLKAGEKDDLTVLREGLCFRPVTSNSRPIISKIPDAKLGMTTRSGSEGGVFIAAGHGPWGISQSLGTGKVLSELVQAQPTSAKIDGLKLP